MVGRIEGKGRKVLVIDDDVAIRVLLEAVLRRIGFDVELGPDTSVSLRELVGVFHRIQRQLDMAINNAALTHELDITIGVSPGRLVFGVPKAAVEALAPLSGVKFAYLIDEFENLTRDQQRYVNTLVREKELPTELRR